MAAAPLNARVLDVTGTSTLESAGVTTVIGTVVTAAGLIHAKTVPLGRLDAFANPGLGASPVWHVFTIDQAGIAVGGAIGVVGDQRIRLTPTPCRSSATVWRGRQGRSSTRRAPRIPSAAEGRWRGSSSGSARRV